MLAYGVRFKGHWCAAVKTGFARKPILYRARRGEDIFVSRAVCSEWEEKHGLDKESLDYFDQKARLECARAIKRTMHAYERLKGDHLLRGVPSVERLEQLLAPGEVTRRGKRWKICVYEPQRTEAAIPAH